MLKAYLYRCRRTAALLAGCWVRQGTVAALYGLPAEPVAYAAALSLAADERTLRR